MSTGDVPSGLRERKHRRTRIAIERAAAELVLEGGLASATISRIAARADVSPRTVSTYFPGKDEIFFAQSPELLARLQHHLEHGTGTTVDRLEQWIGGEAALAIELEASGEGEEVRELRGLQNRAIQHDLELRAKETQLLASMTDQIAAAFAAETGQETTDVAARFFAGATFGVFSELRAMAAADADSIELADVEQALEFLRAGAPALAPRAGKASS